MFSKECDALVLSTLSRCPIITSGIKRVEFFVPLSLSLSMVLQQTQAPSRHAQIISVCRQKHSNQFIIYFIIIPWLQFEADSFIIHDRQPFDSWAFSIRSAFLLFAQHNPDLSSILMLPHFDAHGEEEGKMLESVCSSLVIRLVWCGSALSAGLARPLISLLVYAEMDRCPLRGFVAWGGSKERGNNPSKQGFI